MTALNDNLFRLINNLAGSLSFLNPLVIFLAKYAIFVLAIFMIFLWFTKPRMQKTLIAAAIAFAIAEVLAKILGIFISHEQPFATLSNVYQLIDKEVGNSFPSDHTVLAFSICISLFIGSKSKFKPFYIVLAFLIGIARIWVGVHYPVDVLVGALLGTVAAIVTFPFVIRNKFIKKCLHYYSKLENKLIGGRGKHSKE